MPVLRAVLDTNVLLAVAFAQRGLAREVREYLADGVVQLVTSKALLAELVRVLHYPRIQQRFHPTEEDIAEFLGLLLEQAAMLPGTYGVQKIDKDPSDDMFLAAALEGQADYIVSRDPHLLNLKHFHTIQIVDVAAFVRVVRQRRRHE